MHSFHTTSLTSANQELLSKFNLLATAVARLNDIVLITEAEPFDMSLRRIGTAAPELTLDQNVGGVSHLFPVSTL